jgi:zinc protease
VKPLSGRETRDIDMPKEQSLVLMGYDGVTVKDARQYPLSFIGSLLSGADGLLYRSMREEEGLSYASGAISFAGVDPGYFALFAATTEEKLGAVSGAMLSSVEKIARGDISDEEITACRNKLLSQYAVSIETNAALGMMAALDELYGLGFAHYKEIPTKISSIAIDDVKKCANEILGNNYAVVIIHSSRR